MISVGLFISAMGLLFLSKRNFEPSPTNIVVGMAVWISTVLSVGIPAFFLLAEVVHWTITGRFIKV
jgi:asparagine N-glycosylation enzyme membrane subunit Stt3